MAWKQTVGGWHWGQLIIASLVVTMITSVVIGMGVGIEHSRDDRLRECKQTSYISGAVVWAIAKSRYGIERGEYPDSTDLATRVRYDSVTNEARLAVQRRHSKCESKVGSEYLGLVVAYIGLLLGSVALLTMLWIWFGARRPEAMR